MKNSKAYKKDMYKPTEEELELNRKIIRECKRLGLKQAQKMKH